MASSHVFGHDNAPNPFFRSVSSSLLQRPQYRSFLQLAAQFQTPDANVAEPNNASWILNSYYYVESLHNTTVLQTAWQFLVTKGLVASDWPTFRKFLVQLWFGLYSRTSSGALGSSGFENVFIGEYYGVNVTGLNNWVRYQQQESAGQINYHGWFTQREPTTQASIQFSWMVKQAMFGGLLLGTSPAFDFAVYTVCVMTRPAPQTCSFLLRGNPVVVTSALYSQSGTQTKLSYAYPTMPAHWSSACGASTGTTVPNTGTTGGHSSGSGGDLQQLVDQMWAADGYKAARGDITLNWGSHVTSCHSCSQDVSPAKLFTNVNWNKFTANPVVRALQRIYGNNLFTADTCAQETPSNGLKKAFEQAFISAVMNTTIFQKARTFLISKGRFQSGQSDADLLNQLWTMWFCTYSRCGGSVSGSSGWEHVFSGELRNEHGEIVDGQHNWIRYAMQEQAGNINYYGYEEHDGDLTGAFQYKWTAVNGGSTGCKAIGGFLIGTSPEFDFSLFTVCFLAYRGREGCRFSIQGYQLAVTSYDIQCTGGGTGIATSYPIDL